MNTKFYSQGRGISPPLICRYLRPLKEPAPYEIVRESRPAACMAIIPTLIVFLALQKHFVEGIPIQHTHQDKQALTGKDNLWQGLEEGALWETDLDTVMQWGGVIQPTLWESSPGHIHAIMRSARGHIYRSDTDDYGHSWIEA